MVNRAPLGIPAVHKFVSLFRVEKQIFFGEPGGFRTHDTRIKSLVLSLSPTELPAHSKNIVLPSPAKYFSSSLLLMSYLAHLRRGSSLTEYSITAKQVAESLTRPYFQGWHTLRTKLKCNFLSTKIPLTALFYPFHSDSRSQGRCV